MKPSDTAITVHNFGREGEPVVVIDNFSGQAGALLAAGRAAQFRPGGAGFPGLRATADSSYLSMRRDLIAAVMQRIFGFAHGIRCDISTFSLVTLAEADLKPAQRIPHYDHSGSERIAAMHYLLGPESGGTAFYRHRRTGFEAITETREAAYDAAQWEDEGTLGPPPPRYHYGDSDRYEMIGEIEARPDRLIFYRSRLLHSAVIRDAATLTSDPAKGRLTINMFLSGN